MQYNTTRKIHFDAAHRIRDHESKCKLVHGHRYVLEATFSSTSLDTLGRVLDFSHIRDILKTWIDTYWDHNLILSEEDKMLGGMVSKETGQAVFYLPTHPTAENMAAYLFTTVCPKLFSVGQVTCSKIRLYETPNCYAEVG